MAENVETVSKNKNKNFFDVAAAATWLLHAVEIDVVDRELEAAGIVAADDSDDHSKAVAYLKSQGVTTQGHYAAIVINFTHGEGGCIEPSALTEAVKNAFPNAAVSDRHGPHYLSHARKGQLKGIRQDLSPIPYAKRKPKAKSKEEQEADLEIGVNAPAITIALLMEENDHETLVEMAKGLGIKATAKWKTETVAGKIVELMGATDDGEAAA